MFCSARVKIPGGSILFWFIVTVVLLLHPPKFIGDNNVKLCIAIVLWVLLNTLIALIVQSVANQRLRMAMVVGLLMVLPVISVYSLSSISSWCCVKHADFDRLCNLAARTADHLDRHGIPYWVCWGTLLGAVREIDMPYQAVPWEHDFDLCVYEADWAGFRAAMRNASDVIFNEERKIVFDTNYRTTMARAYVDIYKYKISDRSK